MPNPMNITPPVVGVTTGPAWATDINNILVTQVAPHTHTGTPDGAKLNQNALDFTGDLSLDNQALTNVKLTQYTAQSPEPVIAGSTYRVANDLYYRDGAGVSIRLTLGGSLNSNASGQISGMSGTNATAKFASLSTFEWRKSEIGANTQWANMKGADTYIYNASATNPLGGTILRQTNVLTTDKVILLPPNDLTLPQALPPAGTVRQVSMNSSGVMTTTGLVASQTCANTQFDINNAETLLATISLSAWSGRPILVQLVPNVAVSSYFLQKNELVGAAQNTPINAIIFINVQTTAGTTTQSYLDFRTYDPIVYTNALGGVKQTAVTSFVYSPTAAEAAGTITITVKGQDLATSPSVYRNILVGYRVIASEL